MTLFKINWKIHCQ